MLPVLVGLVGGGLALYFVRQLAQRISSGNLSGVALPALLNLLAVMGSIGLSALLWGEALVYTGIAVSAVLIIGSVALFLKARNAKTKVKP